MCEPTIDILSSTNVYVPLPWKFTPWPLVRSLAVDTRENICALAYICLPQSHAVHHVPLRMHRLCICSVRSIIHAPVTYLPCSRYAWAKHFYHRDIDSALSFNFCYKNYDVSNSNFNILTFRAFWIQLVCVYTCLFLFRQESFDMILTINLSYHIRVSQLISEQCQC
jgi:hypothetical protein